MEASGSEADPQRPWTATSTWAPAGGAAVEDAVSFETSDDDAEVFPSAVVLAAPPIDGDEDLTPCEVTVNFTGKYELHRVYVRSTARTYEIYYSTDQKVASKDYLCTVRCGLAAKEPLPPDDESSHAATSEKHEQEIKSVTSSSDEDSWVEVKIPESLGNNTPQCQRKNATETCQENTLAHYEATAEITDASPCVSLTVRLLSLQSKTSVHIEEIYIFADPVESSNDDSVAGPGNMGASSLLAMLVPGLMQMSKSKNCKVDDRSFSDGFGTQLAEAYALNESSLGGKSAQGAGICDTNDPKFRSAGVENRLPPTSGDTISNEKYNQDELPLNDPNSHPLPVQTAEITQVPLVKDQSVSNTNQHSNPLVHENFTPHDRMERMLDTLLSKVEKMELYCSRFEDNMMRPLGSIESRLQRLEQQFGSFSVEIQSLRGSSARMSVPDGLSDLTNAQEKSHNEGNAGGTTSVTKRQPGLVMRAPEFSLEDSCGFDVADENIATFCGANVVPRLLVKAPDFICEPELTCEKLNAGPSLPVDFAPSSKEEHKAAPGLAVKVPEFPNDEDDEEEEDREAEAHVFYDDHAKSDFPLSKSTGDSSKGRTAVSIDGALASAFEAFLTSTKGTFLSKSVTCTTSNSSGGGTINPSSCSPEQVDNAYTKDSSVGQIHGTFGDADKVGTSISYQEVDAVPHTSVSNANLGDKIEVNEKNIILNGTFGDADKVGTSISYLEVDAVPHTSVSNANLGDKVEVNEENIVLNSDKMAFASTGVRSQPHEGSVDDRTQINGQYNDPDSDTPFVISNEALDNPSQPPTLLLDADEGTQVAEKPPTVFGSVDDIALVNGNRPTLSLAEFLAARSDSSSGNGTSKVCHGNGGAGIISLKRTSAGASQNLEDGDSKENETNDGSQLLLLKKAFDIDEGNSKKIDDIFTDTIYEASSYAASANGANEHGTIAMYTVSDEDGGQDNIENSIRFSYEMDPEFFQLANSKERWFKGSTLDSGINGFFMNPEAEHSWSDLSTMEKFGGASAKVAVSSDDKTAVNFAGDLFASIGAGYNETSVAGDESQKADDLLYGILGMTSLTKRTNESNPSLEALLGESSDSEAQISDLEDMDNDAGFGSGQFSTFSSSDDDAFARDEPLVDVPVPLEVHASAANEALVDVVDQTCPSVSYVPAVNEPSADGFILPQSSETYALVDVVDQTCPSVSYVPAVNEPSADGFILPQSSETYAFAVNEPLASEDELPKTSETFALGSSGQRPDGPI